MIGRLWVRLPNKGFDCKDEVKGAETKTKPRECLKSEAQSHPEPPEQYWNNIRFEEASRQCRADHSSLPVHDPVNITNPACWP